MSRRAGTGHNRRGSPRGTGKSDAAFPDAPLVLGAFATWRGDVTDTATNFDWPCRTGEANNLFREATGANKPTIVFPTELGGLPALRGDGTNTRLVSTVGTARWNFLNQGPMEVHVVTIPRAVVASRYLISTQNGNPCWSMVHSGSASGANLRVFNFTDAGAANYDVEAASVFALNTPVRISHAYEGNTGSTPELVTRINNVVGHSGDAGAPGTNNAGFLHLFQRGNNTTRAQHDIAEVVIFNRVLSTTERGLLDAYFQVRYGFLV